MQRSELSAELSYLNLYGVYSQILSATESCALAMVEVEGASYDAVAKSLGSSWEDVRMLVFHGRQKLFWGMGRTLDELEKHRAKGPAA